MRSKLQDEWESHCDVNFKSTVIMREGPRRHARAQTPGGCIPAAGGGGAGTQKGLGKSLPNDYLLTLTAFSGVKSTMSGKTKSCVTRAQNMWKK